MNERNREAEKKKKRFSHTAHLPHLENRVYTSRSTFNSTFQNLKLRSLSSSVQHTHTHLSLFHVSRTTKQARHSAAPVVRGCLRARGRVDTLVLGFYVSWVLCSLLLLRVGGASSLDSRHQIAAAW